MTGQDLMDMRTGGGALACAVAALGGLLLAGCMPAREAPVDYFTEEVTRGPVASTIETVGVIGPKDSVDVGAQVSGMIEALYVDVGDLVEQGQLLAEFDPRIAEAEVEANRARLVELDATKRQQTAEMELARVQEERSRRLFETGAVSEAEYEAAQTQLEVAQAQLRRLEAQIEGAQYALDGSLTSLGYTEVYAPMSGIVTSLNAEEGQTLSSRQTTPVVLTIADLSVMEVSVDVPEANVGRVMGASRATFETAGHRDRRWQATVRQILPEPEIVNEVVLYKALLDVDNSDRALMPDMTAQVTFDLGSIPDAVRIPADSIRLGNEFFARHGAPGGAAPFGAADPRRTVLVVGENGPEPREIEIGLVGDDYIEVVSGLRAGEVVVAATQAMQNDDDDDFNFRGGAVFIGS